MGRRAAANGLAPDVRDNSRSVRAGAVLDAVQLPPGQKAAFDDEVARRIRDVTDMIPV